MLALKEKTTCSWSSGQSPIVLGDIICDTKSVTIWEREKNDAITRYFEAVFTSLGLGLKGVFEVNTLKQQLNTMLPKQDGKAEVIDDVYLLTDMLTCLFDCKDVGLRLVPLTSAMCPSFHRDNIPVRLVNTYLGAGTQWLPLEQLCPTPFAESQQYVSQTNFGMYYKHNDIQTMNAFEVGMLKGEAWHESLGAVHRSCPVAKGEKRVLLTLDPM
ncbi:DUF1826 domain-containing protein [Alteromonas sp. A081]|uniref:DUF1826 domain-containing protein n=1 Tax=Alteromonas sp. A081 TaxID=3410269 RepID=UPI003B9820A1